MKALLKLICLAALLSGAGGAAAQTPVSAADEGAELRANLSRAQTRLPDWPQLGRYREANGKTALPAKGEARVVFMGDSITDIWGRGAGEFFPGKPYINRGISGQTTPQMLIRFRPDVIALQPKVVVILAGTNDIAGNTGPMTLSMIEDNLAAMAELASANGIKVVLSSITPVSNYHVANPNAAPQTTLRPLARVHAINAWMRRYATEHHH